MHDALKPKHVPHLHRLTSQVHVHHAVQEVDQRKTGCIALVIAKHFLKQILLQGRELKHTQSTCLV